MVYIVYNINIKDIYVGINTLSSLQTQANTHINLLNM